MNIGYKIKSELSEDQIEADVASYLGYITPFWSRRFQLKAVNEQNTGADKLFDKFVPIYLQFKVSEGLKPLVGNINLLSPKRSLQKIRRFRKQNNLGSNPILYFRLRNKAINATDFQHNILKSLHLPPHQFALYVAPLCLTIEEYNQLLSTSFLQRLFVFDYFHFKSISIMSEALSQSLGINPFLRGHISISPHEVVSTSEHYYSFSRPGSDIAWHSGIKLNGDYRFSYQIRNIFEIIYDNKESGFSKKIYVQFINEFMRKIEDTSENDIDESVDKTILKFAKYLKQEYNIKLMLLGINQ